MKPSELNDLRLRIETVDLSGDHARQELNSIYSELISRLREEFLKAEFPPALTDSKCDPLCAASKSESMHSVISASFHCNILLQAV